MVARSEVVRGHASDIQDGIVGQGYAVSTADVMRGIKRLDGGGGSASQRNRVRAQMKWYGRRVYKSGRSCNGAADDCVTRHASNSMYNTGNSAGEGILSEARQKPGVS